jgi:MFS family permease
LRRNFLKAIGGLLAAILLGAIGSGVWEAALKPLLQYLGELIVTLSSSVSVTFKDGLYSEAAEGFHEKHSLALITFIYGVIAGVATVALMVGPVWRRLRALKRERTEAPKVSPSAGRRRLFVAIVGVFSIVALGMFVTARDAYINRVTTWSLTSIERLGGAISPKEYANLRSLFFRVDSTKDFYEFHSRLKAVSQTNNVALEEFDPL